jgi:hypothetical protein
MNEKNEPTAKVFSFGGCDISNTSPALAALTADTKILNVRISFEEALKLHLAIGECIRKLNSYKRNTKAGRRTALNLALHLPKYRLTVNQENLSAKAGE